MDWKEYEEGRKHSIYQGPDLFNNRMEGLSSRGYNTDDFLDFLVEDIIRAVQEDEYEATQSLLTIFQTEIEPDAIIEIAKEFMTPQDIYEKGLEGGMNIEEDEDFEGLGYAKFLSIEYPDAEDGKTPRSRPWQSKRGDDRFK